MKLILLCFIGLCSGLLVAGGMFAFITIIGVVQRMAVRSRTVKHVILYERCVVVGCAAGAFVWMFQPTLVKTSILLIIFGFFSGIYVGALSFALAEILNVLPVLAKRVRLRKGFSLVVLMFALGKLFGAFYQLVDY